MDWLNLRIIPSREWTSWRLYHVCSFACAHLEMDYSGVVVGVSKLGMIEEIEKLSAKLQVGVRPTKTKSRQPRSGALSPLDTEAQGVQTLKNDCQPQGYLDNCQNRSQQEHDGPQIFQDGFCQKHRHQVDEHQS